MWKASSNGRNSSGTEGWKTSTKARNQKDELDILMWTFHNYSKIILQLITHLSYFSSCCLTMSFGHSPLCHEFQTTHWICNTLKNRNIRVSFKSDMSEGEPLCGLFFWIYGPPVLRTLSNSLDTPATPIPNSKHFCNVCWGKFYAIIKSVLTHKMQQTSANNYKPTFQNWRKPLLHCISEIWQER